MSWSVELTKSAAKEIAALPKQEKPRLARILKRLSQDPLHAGIKLQASAGVVYRARAGDYRVLYEIYRDTRTVLVTAVRHRREAYR